MTPAELADAYLAEDWEALEELTEIRDGYAGVRHYWLPGVWNQIMDELERREIRDRKLRWDLQARAEGWRSYEAIVQAVQSRLDDSVKIPPDLAALYLRVCRW